MNFRFKTPAYVFIFFSLLNASLAKAEAWEIRLGLAPVFGTEFRSDLKQGLGAQAYFDLGINDYVSIELAGGYVNHFMGQGTAYEIFDIGLGATFNLDVIAFGVGLAWVPFATVRLGFLQSRADSLVIESGMGVALALGLDYVFDESFSVGIAFDYKGLVTNFNGLPAYLGISLRLGLRWLDF